MFTGIIEETGQVKQISKKNNSTKLTIASISIIKEISPGDSIAINGVCLTATSVRENNFEVDVGEETFKRTTLQYLKIGEKLNLEGALKLTEKLNGHIVTGHIDAVGIISKIEKRLMQVEFTIEFPYELSPYIVEKGSITVDGVSLTIGKVFKNSFVVYIIPYTNDNTTFKFKKLHNKVNLESDIIAKYIKRILETDKILKTEELKLKQEPNVWLS